MTTTPSSNLNTPLILKQIASRLHDIFDNLIDVSDVNHKKPVEVEQYFITRAYMALFLLNELGLPPADAASCITDGGADDGIDLIHVDPKNSRIYLGQSKWRSNMLKGVELNDFTRFRDGVKNIINLRWAEDNKNFASILVND